MKISGRVKEIIGVAAVMLGVVVMQGDLWITGKRMFSHDSIIWFGAFSYFSDCLRHGVLPLWNPYMNSGEIFFLNIHVLHFWDPSTLLLVLIGKLFSINTLTVYHYDLLARYMIFISGGYFFFRRVAKHKFSAFVAFITLSFSALSGSYLKQHAFILPFYLLPWILSFTFKYLEEKKPASLIWLAFFWGITLCSYHAMYLMVSVFVLLMCLLFSGGLALPKIGEILKGRGFVFTAAIIFLLMPANLLPVFLSYTRDTIPTARLFEAPLAAYSYPADFFNLLAPYSFVIHFFNWFYMSEAFLYIGLIPLFFAAVGLLYSRNKYKIGFALTAAIIALLMLGPRFFVSDLFSRLFPFFSIIRNTHTFATFFIFCLAYFVCIGTDVVADLMEKSSLSRYKIKFILITIVIVEAVFLVNNYVLTNYEPILRQFQARYDNLVPDVGQDFALPPKEMFFESYYNVFFFIASIIGVFILIGRKKTSLKFKYSAVIFLILADLTVFNLGIYRFETKERVGITLPEGEFSYNNRRIHILIPKSPFFGFGPAMRRTFTAASTEVAWCTTHFYEMKDFFGFVNNEMIPVPVKSVFMGVTAPKIRFVGNVVVSPPDRQARELSGLSAESANKVLFVEKSLPPKFAGLELPIKEIDKAKPVSGKIGLRGFDPNGISLEVNPARDCFLYYSDGFDRSWRAFVDGKETKVYRTNMAFKSIIVEKGVHSVRFVYDPRLYKAALFCYFAGIVITATTVIYISLKRTEGA